MSLAILLGGWIAASIILSPIIGRFLAGTDHGDVPTGNRREARRNFSYIDDVVAGGRRALDRLSPGPADLWPSPNEASKGRINRELRQYNS